LAQSHALKALGRPIRLGLVGGGTSSMIGPVHRAAARLDGLFDLCAGVLSSDPERSRQVARELNIARGYGNIAQMLEAEASHPQGIDAVAIVTPNDSHFALAMTAIEAGLDVICDKPLTNEVHSAAALARAADARGRVLALTHNYAGYPMVREMRSAVATGELGPLRLLNVSYVQGSLSRRVEDDGAGMADRLKWRLDAARGGQSHVLGDIGVHAHQLATFVAGQRIAWVLADVGPSLPGRQAHDTAQVIFKLEDGTRGQMLVSKVATGAQNALDLQAYGEEAGLCWAQASANDLRVMRLNRPDEVRTRGLPTLCEHARRGTRIPVGHPEAFFEAFANIYADFAELVAARLTETDADPLARLGPDGWTGVEGLAFIEACLQSTRTGGWVEVAAYR